MNLILTQAPLITDDFVVFGILMLLLGFIFYTSSHQTGFWKKFYTYVPALLLCYFLPAILSTMGVISAEPYQVELDGEMVEKESQLYFLASRLLLPAALVLLTLSMDLKAIFGLGPKALIMFFTATLGIVLGGPLALMIVSAIDPGIVGGNGPDEVWRGLATLAGSWIGGGANQAAMLEIFEYNQSKYPAMVLVDIVVANLMMALLILGIGRRDAINKFLKADDSAIHALKAKSEKYLAGIKKVPTTTDLMIILTIAFSVVAFSHFAANSVSEWLGTLNFVNEKGSKFSSLGSSFFWLVTFSTFIGIGLSYTKLRNYEGAGASKVGSVFIYILVATIGMKMDLRSVLDEPLLILVGLIWMIFHALLLFIVAKMIKAPYFFVAVGSQANVGGAASAPVVAAEFHPSLATVGVLLAVFGYAVGTFAAYACALLMQQVTLM